MNGKKRKDEDQKHFRSFVLIVDLLLTVSSILLVSWQSWSITEKYVSHPQSSSTSFRGLADVPETVVSFCYLLTVTDCSTPTPTPFDMFNSYYYTYDEEDEECSWGAGEIPSYGNSTEVFWNETKSKQELDIDDIIDGLEMWNPKTDSWINTLTSNETIVERNVWPFLANEIQICNTIRNPLLSENGASMKIIPKQIATEKYKGLKFLYFHVDGQFLGPVIKQNLFKIEEYDYKYGNAFYLLSVENTIVASTKRNPCENDETQFDLCVWSTSINNTLRIAGCLPPFLAVTESNDEILCSNNSAGEQAFTVFNAEFVYAKDNCLPPCSTNKMDLNYNYHANLFGNMKKGNENRYLPKFGFYISFPSLVEVVESQESYDWVSYVAEVSGWLGLFLGIAVPNLLEIFDKLSAIKIRFVKHVMLITKYLAYIVVICMFFRPALLSVTKYVEGPIATDMKLTSPEKMPKVTISVCKTKQIYSSLRVVSNETFLGNTRLFWEDDFHLEKMISNVSTLQDGIVVPICNGTVCPENHFIKRMMPGSDGTSIDVCYSLKISTSYQVDQIQVNVTDDIFFSVHLEGQLFETAFGSKGNAIKIRKSSGYSSTGANIYGMVYSLELQFIDIKGDPNKCLSPFNNYDQCIMNEVCKAVAEIRSPFCNNLHYIEEDLTKSEKGFKEYKSKFFSKHVWEQRCLIPCQFAKPSLKIVSDRLKANTGPYFKFQDERWAGSANLIIEFPQIVTAKATFLSYTSINMVSELGGWFGLLFGISIFDICCFTFDILLKMLRKSVSFVENWLLLIKIVIALICICCVGWEFVICLLKYLSNPISTNLVIGKMENSIGITFTLCHKGFGIKGSDFERIYTTKENGDIFLGRLSDSFIESLEIQHKSSFTWQVIWNQSSANDVDIFSEFIVPYQDLLYCNSWGIPQNISKFRINSATTKNLVMYLHSTGMFTEPGMRAILKPDDDNTGIQVYNIGLQFSESLSSDQDYCEMNQANFPDNKRAAALAEKMMEEGHCVAPFIKNQNFTCPTMETASKSVLSMKYFQDISTYSLPCKIAKAEFLLDSMTEESSGGTTFIFQLPSTVVSTHSSYSYSFLSFIAEFGSWLGFFTGVALVQVFTKLKIKLKIQIIQGTVLLQYLGSWICNI